MTVRDLQADPLGPVGERLDDLAKTEGRGRPFGQLIEHVGERARSARRGLAQGHAERLDLDADAVTPAHA